MSDLSHAPRVTNLRARRLQREALGAPRDDVPFTELVVRGLYAAGICMILASLFL